MSARPGALAAVALAAVALAIAPGPLAVVAHADTPPSPWERAKDPAMADSYRLHLEVQRRLATGAAALDFGFEASHEAQVLRVRTMLEAAHAETSPDVRLRFDLGHVLVMLARDTDASFYKRAAEVLGPALQMAPRGPGAERAWGESAEACGHIGDHVCERRAYLMMLENETDEDDRGITTMNLAEVEMHFGNLRESIEGYREALRLASRYPSRELAPLSLWGLAVALDRSGDRVAADREALRVVEMQASSGMNGLLRSRGIYFYPEYEISWYDAVGAMALARKPNVPATDAARHWKAAEDAFAAYVHGAERRGPGDRWLELAKVRLAAAKVEREKAEKKRGKLPPPPPADADEETPL